MGKWTRRAFLGAGGLAGGGLLLGVGGVVFAPDRLRLLPDGEAGDDPRLTTWIKITPDNEVVVVIPHCEMGQGARTGIAMMLAEELEADWDRVRIEEAPAEGAYANGYVFRGFAEEAGFEAPGWLERALDFASFKAADIAGFQVTGGSSSTRATGRFGMRVAGAAAKSMLLEAGARTFEVPVGELTAGRSRVVHEASGRSATYGELATLAATLDVPGDPPLKPRGEYRIVGTSHPRPDIPAKVSGEAEYGIDVVRPDMLYAAITASPVPGGTLVSVNPTPAESMPGVVRVVSLEDAVAVVAQGYWHAQQALNTLSPEFTGGGMGRVSTREIYAAHTVALDELGGSDGDGPDGTRAVTAEYRVPYLAHATMEPMCATARVADGRCEVWAGTQDPLNARGVAADAAELDREMVTMHNRPLGGGFGRRLPGAMDYVDQAVRVARAMSPRPVKLIWSREEDMRHGFYRPVVVSRMRSRLDGAGRPVSWTNHFTGSRFMDAPAATPIYSVGEADLGAVAPPEHLRTGSWRSVASSQHGFFTESFVDELAHAAGRDPVAFRLDLLADRSRHHAVLARAAEMAGWSSPLPEGRARGVAIVESFGTVVAEVAEVSVDGDGRIRVRRVDAAVDCGLVVNPDQALAQIEGGIVFGLSAALFHEITVDAGAVQEQSFPDYEMIRLTNMPPVQVEFMESDATMGGLGEPGVPPVAPAVANALFALTGRRLRNLPLHLG